MKTISLICTFHDERGRANVSELHAILERIRPDVIFLEIPFESDQGQVDIGKINNLESVAVQRYLKTRSVMLVPVDMPTPDESFFRDTENLFNEIEHFSYEYCYLVDQNRNRIVSEGFAYLNSESHCIYQVDVHKEVLRTLEKKSNKRLGEVYESWRHTMEIREVDMLSNIESYCGNNEFTRAVFLVGAAHRASIVAKLSNRPTGIQWDYSGNWYEECELNSGQ